MRVLAEFIEALARLAVDEGVEDVHWYSDDPDGTVWVNAGHYRWFGRGDRRLEVEVITDHGTRTWWPGCREVAA